jgi:molybdopterin molybdotransferase
MIDWREAQRRILALAPPVAPETVIVAATAGRWASAPVSALRTQPDADLSSMDGYAIRHADLPGPWRVTGESAAGKPFAGRLGAGEAIRIFTGAALSEGADTILIQEDVTRSGQRLVLNAEPPRLAQWVRPRGADFLEGAWLIDAGARFTPAHLALAVLAGHVDLPVHRRVSLALASTGDELGSRLPDSNGPMLAALLSDLPVDIAASPPIPDDRDALEAFYAGARHHDVIVTTGGASVGDHDLVRPVLLNLGATLDFWKVAMKPGKPVMAGMLGRSIVLALPGNPVSAFVTAHLFLRPLIAHLSGAANPTPPGISVRLGSPLPPVGPRTDFVRMRWQDGALVPVASGDSGALVPLSQAQALAIRPAHSAAAATDEFVEAILIA